MFGLSKIFGKKINTANLELKKVENRDLMQAIIAGGLYISSADGAIEDAEIAKLEELIASNERMAHFGSEIHETISRFQAKFKANFQVGRLAARKELDDVRANKDEAEEVFVNMVALAAADGEVEPEELKALKEVAQMFGLRTEAYGLEG